MKRKDNLTDAVEGAQNSTQDQVSDAWEVIAANGELITLGQFEGKPVQVQISKGHIVLTKGQLETVINMAVAQAIDDFGKEVRKKTLKKLDGLNIDKIS